MFETVVMAKLILIINLNLFILICNIASLHSFVISDQGKWDFELDEVEDEVTVVKSLFKESEIRTQILCEPKNDTKEATLTIIWTLSEISCWKEYLNVNEELGKTMPVNDLWRALENSSLYSVTSSPEKHNCAEHNIQLKEMVFDEPPESEQTAKAVFGLPFDTIARKRREAQRLKQPHNQVSSRPILKVSKDGFYMFTLFIKSDNPFNAKVHIEMKGKHGYLSAADWPLLPFYGAMCLVYVVLGLAWLIVSFLQWRDLLRIQFWIGAVILLGMLEKAMFYAEYQGINTNGQPAESAVLVAELVSCGKRTLARMLVIIVSLGFGIVKPRLGPMLHRTVATGILYFVLAAFEAYLRVMKPKSNPANQMLISTVPLAAIDTAICWWIFTSLVQTTRTLRLRRNIVKLNLYRHFTNTLVFAVISSVVFMMYSIKSHFLKNCFMSWKELWIEDAFWKLLFSVILLVIMILWRPTNNNQRYAFTPLLDAPEDGDDEEEEYFVSDAYGIKMRGGLNSGASSPKPKLSVNSAEEDLKWVEENIPTSMQGSALPVLDSDEEVMNTKFELSKMQ